MATTPFKINERRSSFGYTRNNSLFSSSFPTQDRKSVDRLDYDTDRNLSNYGRRNLLTFGRSLFANFPAVRGAILEQANLSVGSLIPQYYGRNKAWGALAENWLYEWAKILNVRGWPFNETHLRKHIVTSSLVDGDLGILLTETQDGYPQIQTIPAHRIGNSGFSSNPTVIGGHYDGFKEVDGTIQNEYGRTVAYRICSNDYNLEGSVIVDSKDFILAFDPELSDQSRGISALASSNFNFMDVNEWRQFEMLAQKISASQAVVEHNEDGYVDDAQSIVGGSSTSDSTTGSATAFSTEQMDGGTIRYFKAGTGSKIEVVTHDRPNANAQEFEAKVLRSAFAGIEWSVDFSLDPTKAGGASMRIVIDKINRVIAKRQELVVQVMRRIHGWAISKAILLGLLPSDPDWWMFDYQGPQILTADAKYNSDIDMQEYKIGFKTFKRIAGERNAWWEDVQDQLIAEEKRFQERCKAEGVDPLRIKQLTPNGNTTTPNTTTSTQ